MAEPLPLNEVTIPGLEPRIPAEPMVGSSLEAVFELSTAAMVVTSGTGVIMATNPATDLLFGYPRDELVGRCIDRIVGSGDTSVQSLIAEVDATRAQEPAVSLLVESEGHHKDGHRFAVAFTATAIIQPHGGYVLCVVRERPTSDAVDVMEAAYRVASQGLLSFQRDLLVELGRGNGVTGIASVLHRRTGHNVLIVDAAGDVLATAGEWSSSTVPPHWHTLDHPVAAHGVPERHGDYWTAVACPDRTPLGSIGILDPYCTLGEGDRLALEQATSILAADLIQTRAVTDFGECSYAEFALEVLEGCSPSRIASYAAALDYQIGADYRAVAIELGTAGPASGEIVAHVARECGAHSPLVASRAGRIIFLTSDDLPWDEFVVRLDMVFDAPTRIGIGDARPLTSIHDSVTEAVFALDVGSTMRSEHPIAKFAELGVWRILGDSTDGWKLLEFVHEWIGALIEYDRSHGLELVKTLTVYLEGACGIESAATALFVHRNTLRYRLTKISQILGRELCDADVRFQLELACRAWTVIQALEEARPDPAP